MGGHRSIYNQPMIVAALSFVLATQQLNPVLAPTGPQLLKCWQTGFDDAQKWKNSDGAWDQAKKGIGSINNKAVSFLWWLNPRLLAYESGFQARRQYLPEETAAKQKAEIQESASQPPKTLNFRGTLSLMPKFSGPNGTIGRPADPADLDNVRCVLQVGDKIYQPIAQPGDLRAERFQGTNNYFVNQSTTETIRQSGQKDKTKTTTIQVPFSESYDWYQGTFDVSFELWDTDGKPRISSDETEFMVIVIQRFGENKATFKLKDWADKFSK